MSITEVPAAHGPATRGGQQQPRSIVVIGAGLAGTQTVAALRTHGYDGRITLLGAEGRPPYDRPPLSKELLTRTDPAWLSDELGVDVAVLADDVRLADPAVRLEVHDDGVVVRTTGAHGTAGTIGADAVVLACGSRPVRPASWSDALVLHTAADAAVLRERLATARRLVVVGAGWIGAEVAGVVAAGGTAVTVVEAASAPLTAQLGAVVGASTAQWYVDAGVDLLTGASVATVDRHGVTLVDGRRVLADVVLAAVGAVPVTDRLRGVLPLTSRGAVPVGPSGLLDAAGVADGTRLTARAASRVWAVGDCADRRTDRFGVVAGSHWTGALLHPEAIACAITGRPAPPESAPYVFSDQLGHHLTLTGIPAPDAEVVHRGTPGSPAGWTTLWLRPSTGSGGHTGGLGGEPGGRELVAVLTVDRPRDVGPSRRMLAADRPPLLDLVRARDPGVPLPSAVVGPIPPR
ncbi:MAG TPA: FAD-dependent oxidoreductase [Cellulomonadaceae bacterium]|nr:FAD-dependent oxidoreductase [Cellulomonadaceae bacterium]